MAMTLDMADPRGALDQVPEAPARRLDTLAGAHVVLVDNGKLAASYQSFVMVGEAIPQMFEVARWSRYGRDFLRYHHSQLAGPIDEIVALAPDAVVLALADAGVSVQTMLVTIALEQKGIPTVVVATALGGPACRAIAKPRMPALPIIEIDIARSDPPDAIRAVLGGVREAIESALVQDRSEAAAQAATAPLVFTSAGDAWDAAHDFQDWLESHELGDGLPLLPPVPAKVAALLASVPADADEVIYSSALTSGRSLRVRDVAVNAAMTGCHPRSFPVVLAALRAMARPDFRLLQAAITTHPSGYFVLLSGGDPSRFGLTGGAGCLGPGQRGNLAVGRTVSLTVQHLFGARPGGSDLTSFGSPAEISYCMAEDLGAAPWPFLAADRGFDGPAVLVVKAEGPRNVLEHLLATPVALCEAIASGATALCANNAYVPGDLVVLLNPEHSEVFTKAGWQRSDVAQAVHRRAVLPVSTLDGRGVAPIRPAWMDGLDMVPCTRSPADVHVVLGGAPGPHSMVALPWGFSRGQWEPVAVRHD